MPVMELVFTIEIHLYVFTKAAGLQHAKLPQKKFSLELSEGLRTNIYRRSRSELFSEIGVFKNLANFAGKHLC